ncbi:MULTISPECIES: 4-hydroxy-tetrahydrodipicolinate reductase [Curvivirga]|uniref:4-hydroxy-tetrahydrodipicolinate reductase n=1 Tax=Curvivirga TaxID=2856846 RepID=UPI0012BB544F|nr:4-hydroxy-tetrahydrodipicolinate reductase [Curvivirga aplysinae]MTI11151.1 4-hydroxy-tetrahydrodipicolinate reductase [Curvivirga aplysinae]
MSDLRKVAIVGCAGRMGQMLVTEVINNPKCELSGATDRAGSSAIGRDAAAIAGLEPCGVIVEDDAARVIMEADVVIDFTAPAATVDHLRLCAQASTAIVIGTTGLTKEDEANIDLAARHVPVVYAANYSVGVTLLNELTRKTAEILDDDYDIDVLEMHHKHKVDAPSGTALMLGKAAAAGRGVDHDEVKQAVRDGQTGARPRGEIGYATLRGGDVVGEHSVYFAADGERLILTHKASSRQVFSKGAVRAAIWATDAERGVYDMTDVLGLKQPIG